MRRFLSLLALVLLLVPRIAAAAPVAAPVPPVVDDDLTTPRRAVTAFLDAAKSGDWDHAIRVLDVPANANAAKKLKAYEEARELDFLLTRTIWVNVDSLSDEMAGTPTDGADVERVATTQLAGHDLPITLKLVKGDPQRWVFSANTVTRITELYAQDGPTIVEQKMPDALKVPLLGMAAWQWAGLVASILIGLLFGRGISYVVHAISTRIATRTQVQWDDDLVKELHSPVRLFLTLFFFHAACRLLTLPTTPRNIVFSITSSLFLVDLSWMVMRIVDVIAASLERRATRDSVDLDEMILKARGVRTQARVLRRVIHMAVVCVTTALILMQFEVVRNIGVSLLASAGVAGIVLGLAAQRTIGSVVAGIQLAITQPIRIGDAVLVENEFGTIEEITLTYVVIKVWDERRLVVPMSRFFEFPFQNWTKSSSQLHGTVMIYADWTLPLPELRKELDTILDRNPLWDTRTKAVHLTDSKDRVIEVRVLVSASDASKLFDLRADVREKLVAWLQSFDGGRHLPGVNVRGPVVRERTVTIPS